MTRKHHLLTDEQMDRISQDNLAAAKIPAWVWILCLLLLGASFCIGRMLP